MFAQGVWAQIADGRPGRTMSTVYDPHQEQAPVDGLFFKPGVPEENAMNKLGVPEENAMKMPLSVALCAAALMLAAGTATWKDENGNGYWRASFGSLDDGYAPAVSSGISNLARASAASQ
jgi:hypothetical protein